ncbi:MAG: hypothetical protein JRJ44_04760 [Deltaproteobacteria bacterium]|nr:hypothetical protein [Deltaproteobacteria bacterium]
MKKVVVIIKEPYQQYEGLRTSLGALLEDAAIKMIVLNNEIQDMNEAYSDNMEFLDEMEGERFSNNSTNIEKYGFQQAGIDQIGQYLKEADVVIPF